MSDIDLDALLSGGDKPPEKEEQFTYEELARVLYYGDRWRKATWPADEQMFDRFSVRVIALFQNEQPGEFAQALVWIPRNVAHHVIRMPNTERDARSRTSTSYATVGVDGRAQPGAVMMVPAKEVEFS